MLREFDVGFLLIEGRVLALLGLFLHAQARVIFGTLLLIFFDQGGVLALRGSFCMRERRLYLGFYCLFSLTPVRGGTYFLCCAKESKQRKALHPANS
jgi:hypothetical protein